MNIICKLVGHNPYNKQGEWVMNYDGDPVCVRCGKAFDWGKPNLWQGLKTIWYRIEMANPFRLCPMCGKIERFGDHTNYIPF